MRFLIAWMLLLCSSTAFAADCPLSLSGGVEREWQSVDLVSRHNDGKHEWTTEDSDLQGHWQGYVVGRAEIRPDLYVQARAIHPFDEGSHFGYAAGIEYRFWCSGARKPCEKPCADKPVYHKPPAKRPCK